MPATATLVYEATRYGPVSAVALTNAMSNVNLDTNLLSQIGATLNSDATAAVGPDTVRRTIVFNLAVSFTNYFPNGSDQAAPFRNLYTDALAGALMTKITASPPVVV